MIRVHVICEGATEEEFVRSLLVEPLQRSGIILLPSQIGKVGHKGGNVNVDRLALDVRGRLLNDRQCYCTTLLDYYGLPSDFPGKREGALLNSVSDKQSKVVSMLSSWAVDKFGSESAFRFIPYVQMYEFEGLLFSDPSRLARAIGCATVASEFGKIRNQFSSPEEINDGVETAPSKRIKKLFQSYDKPNHPMLAAMEIGLEIIRSECYLFDSWLKILETISTKGAK